MVIIHNQHWGVRSRLSDSRGILSSRSPYLFLIPKRDNVVVVVVFARHCHHPQVLWSWMPLQSDWLGQWSNLQLSAITSKGSLESTAVTTWGSVESAAASRGSHRSVDWPGMGKPSNPFWESAVECQWWQWVGKPMDCTCINVLNLWYDNFQQLIRCTNHN